MNVRPTPKQLATLNAIAALSREYPAGFTFAEIARRVGVTKVTTFEHVQALAHKGLIAKGEPCKPRGVSLTAAGERLVTPRQIVCPHCGTPFDESLRRTT